jgi:hypothetical protein
MDVKKKGKKEKKRKQKKKYIYSQKCMCVFECFFYGFFFNDKITKNKEEFNILIFSRSRIINLYISCISNIRWKNKSFKTSLTRQSHEVAYLR